MKNIFITGITGLLGGNLAIDLLKQGYHVSALLRNKKIYKEKLHPNLKLIEGNLTDNISQHLFDIDIFIHVAAETNPGLLNYSDYEKINVSSTKHLHQICIESDVKKFIFISTANTIGFGSLKNLGNEDKAMKWPFKNAGYALSKFEAEQHLISKKNELDVIIINPTFMIGAYDNKPSSGKIILMGLNKKIIFYPPGGKNFVNVKDATQGIINSFEYGKNGERYLIAKENLSFKEFFLKINSITNQNPIMIKVPKWLLISIGYFGDLLRYFKVPSSISSTNTAMLCINNHYCNQKSIQNLKVNYNPVKHGIKDAIEYFSTLRN